MSGCLSQEPVREPGIAWQERAVQIRAKGAPQAAALVTGLSVVSETGDHAAQRLRTLAEIRAPCVVLEPRQSAPLTGLQLALEQHVADHASFAGDGMERKEAHAGLLGAALVAVEAAHQLVTAADGEEGSAVRDCRSEGFALRGQIRRDQGLLAVLAAADVEQVVRPKDDLVSDPERPNVQLEAPPGCPLRKDGQVAAVRVDVQVIRIQVTDDDLHAA